MSINLPETKTDMLKIVGVTEANFEKYGRDLLKITEKFAEEKHKISKYNLNLLSINMQNNNYHVYC